MEENTLNVTNGDTNHVPDSPKPMAFTIDFGDSKSVDTQRHKLLAEKFQNRHRRGQSLSKLDDSPASVTNPNTTNKKHPLSVNLPRKTNLQPEARSEGYFSSDEKQEKIKTISALNNLKLRDGLKLPLKNVNSDKMTQSCTLPSSSDLPDESVSPQSETATPINTVINKIQSTSLKCKIIKSDFDENQFVDGKDFDFDKYDAASDAGTYTLDADNYSEEQKERMSIDREFKIEEVSDHKKTLDYVQSLSTMLSTQSELAQKPQTLLLAQSTAHKLKHCFEPRCKLSPILSPTQNMSITQNSVEERKMNNVENSSKAFTKIMFPNPKAKMCIGADNVVDQGSVISVTSSGVFRSKQNSKQHSRQLSLSKSEVQIEVYTDNNSINMQKEAENKHNLSANLVLVSENVPNKSLNYTNGDQHCIQTNVSIGKVINLPPQIGGCSGKASPTKIPSPLHTSRPRSRNSSNSLNLDLSDSSLETESYLKPTQNLLNSLQQRLSLENKYDERDHTYLNNDARNLLKKPTHTRHNSLDERNLKFSNKLEHFANKNIIDQTYTNVLNQYSQRVQHKIQNSPNNSPIRRSSSFSTKNQINSKCSNIPQKESNVSIRNSPNYSRNGSIQRSSSTANIRPNLFMRRSSFNSDRNQYGDTESSSEDDYEKHMQKKDITNPRYNRAVSLRRARLDEAPKCPNTPEMRRKFQPDVRADRSFSVDRKPAKCMDVQSRYLQSAAKSKSCTPPPVMQPPPPPMNRGDVRHSPKVGNIATKPAPKPQVFSRTDTGRFSMRTVTKPPVTNMLKNTRKDNGKKQSGPRSNSSLTSKEQEFQMWKRRKSYDPMKAAAEGKRKAELAKKQTSQNPMTQSYHEGNNQDCDSSPSHSSSVHRSQSFHGTAALEQFVSSEEDDEDLTLSADEGFSPPMPSPRHTPNMAKLRYAWKDQLN